ncbi:MAG: hypothetical protein Q7R73_01645 [bacterium]|nr:hypothetical protein [bacterium]
MQKRTLTTLLAALCISTFVAGCVADDKFDYKIENVVRIFMHEPGHYTFFIKNEKTPGELEIKTIGVDRNLVKIFTDLLPSKNPWVRHYTGCSPYPSWGCLEIHIRNPQDVQGGGWNHGKFGRGTTVVVE